MIPDEFIARFPGARGGNGKWTARCPAHQDRSPSLSIGVAPDGRILLHCFAGCEPEAILAAVGLSLNDLFPDKGIRDYLPGAFDRKVFRKRLEAEQLLAVAQANMKAGLKLTDADKKAVYKAVEVLRGR